jgi:DNA-binding response OmpR family regulator
MSASGGQRCVLIVEDEMALAMMLEDLLDDAGYRVIKAARLPAAVALAESAQIDAAILDINLGGTAVFPAAAVLRRRGIPFVFTSGYGSDGLPPDFLQAPILQKPYDSARLQEALASLLGGGNIPVPGM